MSDRDEEPRRSRAEEPSLRERWAAFASIIFDPWAIALFVVATGLAVGSVIQTEPKVAALLTFVLSLVTGVLGAVYWQRWQRLSQERTISARGKTAVRSLKLLLGHVGRIERRVRQNLGRFREDEEGTITDEVVRTYLEEVIEECGHLEEQVLSAIENWTDLVPEADIRTQIGEITKLRGELRQRSKELQDLEEELEARRETEEETERLQLEVEEKQEEVSRLRQKLAEESFDGSFVSSSTGGGFAQALAEMRAEASGSRSIVKCTECGSNEEYDPLTGTFSCPSCESRLPDADDD